MSIPGRLWSSTTNDWRRQLVAMRDLRGLPGLLGNVVRVVAAVRSIGLTVVSPHRLVPFLSKRPIANVV